MIDTHAHLDIPPLDIDVESLLKRSARGEFPAGVLAPAEGLRIEKILMPGVTADSCDICVRLAQTSPMLYAAVGIHPNYCAEARAGDLDRIDRLAALPRVVAVGETGLDLYRNRSPLDQQKAFFQRQIKIARSHDLPIIIHCRDAQEHLMPILRKESEKPGLRGVIHSFSGDTVVALEVVSLGYYVSFTGAVTYTNRKFDTLREAAKAVPADRILIETDAPFLTPHPYRGKLEANEPLMTAFVADTLAKVRNCPIDEIVRQTTQNARTLFGFD